MCSYEKYRTNMSTETGAASERYRGLGPFPQAVATVFGTASIVVAIIYIFGIMVFGRSMLTYGYFCLLQALLFPVTFLLIPAHPRLRLKLQWYDILLASLAFIIPLTLFLKAWPISVEGWEIRGPIWASIVSAIYWLLILEGCRRAVGLFFCIFLLVFSIYPLFAYACPGILKATHFSWQRVAAYHILGEESVNGLVMGVIAKLFIGFLLFSSTLMTTGAGKAFIGVAMSVLGHVRGGAAKVSVFSSALAASITGGPVANVLMTGPVTIPAMKKSGYPAHYAGAVECDASTGGVLMPPVMGAAAFLMAAMLDIHYYIVCAAAIVPIFLYYVGLFVQVDGFAAKTGIKGLPKSELPAKGKAVRAVVPYLLGIIVLILLLVYSRREAQAPFYSVIFMLAATFIRKETRLGLRGFIRLIQDATRMLAELLPTLMGIGFVLGSLMMTGVAQGLTSWILHLAGDNVYLLLILGGIASFILGMGLTTSACYLLLAVLLAPTLVSAGLDKLAVHMFILYCGMLSFITPPVAIGAFTGAALAGAPPMKTGYTAMRLGAVLFIIPFLFVLSPAFILHGTPLEIVHIVSTGFLGVIGLASGIEGYLVGWGRLAPVPRLVMIASGILLFLPGGITDIIGVALVILLFLFRLRLRRRASLKKQLV